MPDLREWLLLAVVAGAALLAIAWPFLGPRPAEAPLDDPEREARGVRHRVALESLRDLEADHRAGLLDDESYAAQRAEAEERAARTLAEPAATAAARPDAVTGMPRSSRRVALAIGGVLGVLLAVAFALPRPVGIGEATATNAALAQALEQESARQARIASLLDTLTANPRDTQALSDLADAYLAGSGTQDLQRAAAALLLLVNLEPENGSAYRRLITAYINAGDWTDARTATESYAAVAAADEPDIPFFRGLIALRADGDDAEAVRQFDRFLELAPDDGRATMIRSLRAEAAGALPGASASPRP